MGSWTSADLGSGFDLLQANNAAKLTEFAYQWSDLMELEFMPVLEDAELAAVFGRVAKR